MSYFGTIYADTELPSRARAVYMYLRDRAPRDRKSTRLNSSHLEQSRMPSSA